MYQLLQSNTAEQERAYGSNEELVNASLLSFLQVVCAMHPDVDSDWNQARVHLTFDFRKVTVYFMTGRDNLAIQTRSRKEMKWRTEEVLPWTLK